MKKLFKKKENNVHKDLYEMYKELFGSSVRELQFANLQIEYLVGVLDELKAITSGLEKKVIENAIEKYNLDKLIHAKLLSKDNKETLDKTN